MGDKSVPAVRKMEAIFRAGQKYTEVVPGSALLRGGSAKTAALISECHFRLQDIPYVSTIDQKKNSWYRNRTDHPDGNHVRSVDGNG
jgi:hypothetical protein